MTQQQFDNLPGLLTTRQFIIVTGIQLRKLREMRMAGALKGIRMKGWTHHMYRKCDAAQITGFKLN